MPGNLEILKCPVSNCLSSPILKRRIIFALILTFVNNNLQQNKKEIKIHLYVSCSCLISFSRINYNNFFLLWWVTIRLLSYWFLFVFFFLSPSPHLFSPSFFLHFYSSLPSSSSSFCNKFHPN